MRCGIWIRDSFNSSNELVSVETLLKNRSEILLSFFDILSSTDTDFYRLVTKKSLILLKDY